MYNTIDHKNKIGEENSKRWMNGILTCNLKHCQFQNNQDIFRKVMGWRWFWCGSMFTNRSNICCSLQNLKYFGKQNHWLDGGDLKDNNSNPSRPYLEESFKNYGVSTEIHRDLVDPSSAALEVKVFKNNSLALQFLIWALPL